MDIRQFKKLKIPISPGCYQFYDRKGEIIYIGKAANLQSRVSSYFSRTKAAGFKRDKQKSVIQKNELMPNPDLSPAKIKMVAETEGIKWIETDSEIEALLLESNLIKKHQPPFNVLLRDDKRFAYVKISLGDEVPGVFLTRVVDKSGKYFGPFVSTQAVRETLKAIRKVWPYCTERSYKKKPCFYYQINLCLGICGHRVDKKTYLEEVIKPIILFFEGKKRQLVSGYKKELKTCEKEIKMVDPSNETFQELEEKILRLRIRLLNINSVLDHANILGIGEKYANDVVELAKVLGLKKVPDRIEGYDIANIFGREAVGSMVVFSDGEADKNEYRKFKIKIGQGEANDVKMLKEILERRFHNDWALPGLIIIDGGKAQLNAALSILKKNKLDIHVISISKGSASEIREASWPKARISRAKGLRSSAARDKLHFPGEKKPLELPLASPALHLIKRVRDEAHRFAITYHRKLRGKRFLIK